MKLIACHIENFGKLHDFDISFTDGLNVICRENGWGKSTLAAFVKSMLYGLDGAKKRDIDGNERRRFTPWQGGVFGGRLVFETDGRNYSVTRTFGDSPAKDTFELRDADTNLVSRDYSERLGEELFKLNSASFCRSIFIGQSDCLTSSTDDIHAKIGDLADSTGDMNSYEAADERLKKQINALSPKLKSGSLCRLSNEITELRRKVAEGNGLVTEISACEEKIAAEESKKKSTAEKKAALEAKQKRAIKMQELLAQKSEWERLKKARDESKYRLDQAASAFPAGIPDQDAVRENLRSSVELKSAESLMHSYELSESEQRKLAQNDGIFDREAPSSDDFDRYFRLSQELRRVREKYERLSLTDEERSRFDALTASFSGDGLSPSELAERWNERCGVSHSIGSKRAACAAIEASVKKTRAAGKRRAFLLGATGLAIIAAAVALFVFLADVRFLAITIVGLLFLIAGTFLGVLIMGNIVKKYPDELLQLRSDISQDESFIIETDAYTEHYLMTHGMTFYEPDVPLMLQELCEEKRDLDRLTGKVDIAENYRREKNLTALCESIGDFLRKYGVQPEGDRLSDQLYGLKETVAEYAVLSDKRRRFESAEQVFQTKQASIRQFLDTYGFSGGEDAHEALEAMRSGLTEYGRLSALHSAAAEELEAFEAGGCMEELRSLADENIPSLASVSEEISQCGNRLESVNESIRSLQQRRDVLSARYAEWENHSAALLEKTEQQAAQRLKYERLVRTREFLRRAKESMVARYVDPIYQSFRKYHETVTGRSSDDYFIDAEVNLTVQEFGKQREIKSLSTGFRDLAGICLRLGLADAMFREEKPMLIMDDPFACLDDEKAAAAKTLLRKVAEQYQVIYFTCSHSRS